MNRISVPFLGILLLSFVTACDTAGRHRKLDLPRTEVAELRGIPSEFKLLGTTRSLVFTSLDGEALKKGWADNAPTVLDVHPGKHRLGLYYSIKFDGQHGPTGELEAEIDAEGGKFYQADLLHSDAKGWYVEFHETTPKPAKTETDE
jgi:hypothetical protein